MVPELLKSTLMAVNSPSAAASHAPSLQLTSRSFRHCQLSTGAGSAAGIGAGAGVVVGEGLSSTRAPSQAMQVSRTAMPVAARIARGVSLDVDMPAVYRFEAHLREASVR